MKHYDVIIIGAGAAGLMCAAEAGKRGRRTLILDHAEKAGKKILISGGGRCNFTNLHTTAADYISHNPHFCKSALSRFTPYDTLAMFEAHAIAWHEREHGQLFCNDSAKQVVTMLLERCTQAGVEILCSCEIQTVTNQQDFHIKTNLGSFQAASLVIATGGLSIPKMGATGFGHHIAQQFGLNTIPTQAGLVPFRFTGKQHDALQNLAGISLPVVASCHTQSFREAMLFTHRGISGPAMLQISSYWQAGDEISINLLPDISLEDWLKQRAQTHGKQQLHTALSELLPKRLVLYLCEQLPDVAIQQLSHSDVVHIHQALHHWKLKPAGTEGYRTAEVTLGGVHTHELSSKTMESKKVQGLYFVGEVVDVTGHLGGFNFQWAWASGYAAGQCV